MFSLAFVVPSYALYSCSFSDLSSPWPIWDFQMFFNSYYSCFSYSYSDHFIIIILFQMILILIQTIHHPIDNYNICLIEWMNWMALFVYSIFMFVSIDGIIFKQVRLEETTTIVHGNFDIALGLQSIPYWQCKNMYVQIKQILKQNSVIITNYNRANIRLYCVKKHI